MTPTLRSLQTLVPDTEIVQEEVRDVFRAQPDLNRLGQRIVSTSFDVSGIATRHTVIDELRLDARPENPRFFDGEQGLLLSPGTKARNELYIETAGPLFVEAARRAIEGAEGVHPADITHVVTVSCTGFFAPGPDFLIARELELRPGVQRYHLGFMGCYAAMPALRAAAQFCEADPNAVVLVVSVELCTLHLRSSNDPDTIVASSLFGDGAASGIVSSRPLAAGERGLQLDRFETVITPLGESDMAWTIGDHGFEMVLSTYVPQIIEQHVVDALRPLLADDEHLTAALEADTMSGAVEHWAIHPGGRSILDRVQHRLELSEQQLEPARGVLHDVGNMSSATVLFVLQRILQGSSAAGERVVAMAFGPGLTVESALLEVVEGLTVATGPRIDFRERDIAARELMDDPDCDRETLHRTYERFALVNAVLGDARALYRREIVPRARQRDVDDPVRVLDVGAGGADVARALLERAHRDRLPVEVVAIDPDPRAAWWALRQDAVAGLTVRRAHSSELVADDERFDLVISNHVLHHLDAHELGALLADSEHVLRPGGAAVHADLVRSALAYGAFAAATLPLQPTVLRGSYIRPDGLTSIRRAFRPAELAAVVPPSWRVQRVSPWRLHVRYTAPLDGRRD